MFKQEFIFFLSDFCLRSRIYLQLLQRSTKVNIDMEIFYKILNCGHPFVSTKKTNYHNIACSKGHKAQCQQVESYRNTHKSKNLKLKTINRKIKTNIMSIVPKITIGSRFLEIQQNFAQETSFKNGYFIGIVNNHQSSQLVLEDQYFPMRVGPFHEINSLKSVRQGSFDDLLVYSIEKESYGILKDILLTNTRISFILNQFQQIQTLINDLDNQFQLNFKESPLLKFSKMLVGKIYIFKNRIIVELGGQNQKSHNLGSSSSMQNSHFLEDKLKKNIQKYLNIQKRQNVVNKIMEKITIKDYISMKNNPEQIQNYVYKFYHKVLEELRQASTNKQTHINQVDEEQNFDQQNSMIQDEQNVKNQQILILREQYLIRAQDNQEFDDSIIQQNLQHSEDLKEQALYLAAANKVHHQTTFNQANQYGIDQQMQIFYFNDLDTREESDEIEEDKSKTAIQRKYRSRSQDIKYQTAEEFLDDELFQKYS